MYRCVQNRKSKPDFGDKPDNSRDSPGKLPIDKPVFVTSPKVAHFFRVSTFQIVYLRERAVGCESSVVNI